MANRLPLARYLLLAALCLAAFLPGISSLPVVDRDEARYIQSTRQMVETGNYVDIRLQDVPRYKKPVGIYWLQSAAVLLSGKGDTAPPAFNRLVSVAGATLAVLATAWLGTLMFGPGAGMIAGFIQLSVFMIGFEARIAKTDATLLATVVIAQAALGAIWLASRENRAAGWAAPIVFWLAQGAGILIKGPITPLVSALTIAALAIGFREARWIGRLKPLVGIPLIALVVAPWLVAITMKSGGAFWSEAVGRDLLSKVGSGAESHGAPPGYYTLIFTLFIWPFGRLAIRGGLDAVFRLRTDPRLAFLVAWYVPFWLMIEIVATKLPHYVLPIYPAIILATAAAIDGGRATRPQTRWWAVWLDRLTLFGHGLVTLLLAAVAAGAPFYLTGEISVAGIVAAVLILAAGTLSSGLVMRRDLRRAVPMAVILAIASFGLLATSVLPSLKPIWLTPSIAEIVRANSRCPQPALASAGYHEMSLVIAVGTDTLLTDGAGAVRYLTENPECGLAALTQDETPGFLSALPGETAVEAVGSVSGINYSNGRDLTVTVYRLKSP